MRRGLFLFLAALPVVAGTLDVSTATTVFLHNGYTLSFGVADWNFGIDAANLGLPGYPTQVAFAFTSAPLGTAGQFAAVLESANGALSVPFSSPAVFSSGMFQGTYYRGPVSAAQGSVSLSPAESQQLFAGSGAFLTLYYTGPDITVGLGPYTIQQDMTVSLAGSGLSVGAPQGRVILDPPDPVNPVPEPGPGQMLAAAAALSCLLWQARRSGQGKSREFRFPAK